MNRASEFMNIAFAFINRAFAFMNIAFVFTVGATLLKVLTPAIVSVTNVNTRTIRAGTHYKSAICLQNIFSAFLQLIQKNIQFRNKIFIK
ncbi:hypothetical protein C8P67_104288 [Flavobacterium aquicola]|uniref:Uncharacterized protein n=1 Tax=Flavobacterium aquicola TaxID=1682742 RepID=A0A3E0EN99_9FLAO|nr:hypothetical protein C8P67_104288 [Flavobacterium aquicola]